MKEYTEMMHILCRELSSKILNHDLIYFIKSRKPAADQAALVVTPDWVLQAAAGYNIHHCRHFRRCSIEYEESRGVVTSL